MRGKNINNYKCNKTVDYYREWYKVTTTSSTYYTYSLTASRYMYIHHISILIPIPTQHR